MADRYDTAPPPPDDPLVARDLGAWFGRSVAVTRRSLVPLTVIQLLVFVPVALVVGVLGGLGVFDGAEALAPGYGFDYALSTDVGLVRVVSAVLGTLGLTASVFVIVRDAAGVRWTPGEVLGFAGRRFLPLLGWTVLSAVLTVIGYVLLVLPGVYLTIVFGGALLGVVAVERSGLGRTFTLVNQRFLGTVGRLLTLFVITVGYGVAAVLLGGLFSLGSSPGDPELVVSQLVINLLTIPLVVFTTSALVVLYCGLRADEAPGTGTRTFLAEIDRR
ncbi:hypothetical protein [Pseudonocardia sp. HH130630-07]|uniref:hypothetical protein n=1 Tax=Pseudonocardia sp. HH130630-07 TaxID=1690815 RepID=UPI000814E211|nr:hypothetical protein [Pseudonocardia sp. HH130630-07]ANY09519.1 hypothetical protein AFB00_28435 [Pseudonocardia sp. HH130630-07]